METKSYEIKKAYQKEDALRKSFNELSEKTFGLNFEKWYQSGFWQEKYIPYSVIKDNQVIANVSVNIMDMYVNGEEKHYIQLGTVMTDEAYRNQGLSRLLMDEIMKDYKETDIYLWGNDTVEEFYPKFGFIPSKEYQLKKAVKITDGKIAVSVPMETKEQWNQLAEAILNSAPNCAFEMNNLGLWMFYIVNFMGECVYYVKELDAYVIAEISGNNLELLGVFSKEKVDVEQVINAFGSEIETVSLGFTPYNKEGYTEEEISQEDSHFFVMGKDMEAFAGEHKMFPNLSHA